MAKLSWGNVTERAYEAGVDRGVLYPITGQGVVWNGLTAVQESPSGGTPTPYYLDGIKYLNVASSEDFEGSISAYSSPVEFALCNGSGSIANGLLVTQQPRTSFGFSYRTMLGNAVYGLDRFYKIHLVYNALAAPNSQDNSTIGSSTSPVIFIWQITTLPVLSVGYKPSAHYVIDASIVPTELLSILEDILYGTNTSAPRMPTPTELLALFVPYAPLSIMLLPNGAYSASGGKVIKDTPATFTINDTAAVDNGDGSFTITY